MQKMMKQIGAGLLMMLLAVCLSGCAAEDFLYELLKPAETATPVPKATKAPAVVIPDGHYAFLDMKDGGAPEMAGLLPKMTFLVMDEANANSYLCAFDSLRMMMQGEVDGEKGLFLFADSGVEQVPYTLEGDTLTLTVEGASFRLKKTAERPMSPEEAERALRNPVPDGWYRLTKLVIGGQEYPEAAEDEAYVRFFSDGRGFSVDKGRATEFFWSKEGSGGKLRQNADNYRYALKGGTLTLTAQSGADFDMIYTACRKPEGPVGPSDASANRYYLYSIDAKVGAQTPAQIAKTQAAWVYIQFLPDGTGSFVSDVTLPFTYDGECFTDPSGEKTPYTLSGDQVVFTVDGQTMTFKKGGANGRMTLRLE